MDVVTERGRAGHAQEGCQITLDDRLDGVRILPGEGRVAGAADEGSQEGRAGRGAVGEERGGEECAQNVEVVLHGGHQHAKAVQWMIDGGSVVAEGHDVDRGVLDLGQGRAVDRCFEGDGRKGVQRNRADQGVEGPGARSGFVFGLNVPARSIPMHCDHAGVVGHAIHEGIR